MNYNSNRTGCIFKCWINGLHLHQKTWWSQIVEELPIHRKERIRLQRFAKFQERMKKISKSKEDSNRNQHKAHLWGAAEGCACGCCFLCFVVDFFVFSRDLASHCNRGYSLLWISSSSIAIVKSFTMLWNAMRWVGVQQWLVEWSKSQAIPPDDSQGQALSVALPMRFGCEALHWVLILDFFPWRKRSLLGSYRTFGKSWKN